MQLIKHYFYILKNMKNTLTNIFFLIKNALMKGVRDHSICVQN